MNRQQGRGGGRGYGQQAGAGGNRGGGRGYGQNQPRGEASSSRPPDAGGREGSGWGQNQPQSGDDWQTVGSRNRRGDQGRYHGDRSGWEGSGGERGAGGETGWGAQRGGGFGGGDWMGGGRGSGAGYEGERGGRGGGSGYQGGGGGRYGYQGGEGGYQGGGRGSGAYQGGGGVYQGGGGAYQGGGGGRAGYQGGGYQGGGGGERAGYQGGRGGRAGYQSDRGGYQGGGGRRGRGFTCGAMTVMPDELVPQLSRQIKPQLVRDDGRMVPMKRPDDGGVLHCCTIKVHVNHFRLKFNRELSVSHYDIDISPLDKMTTKIRKPDLLAIKNNVLGSDVPYDGGRSLFSDKQLDEVSRKKVELRGRTYEVSIKFVKEICSGKIDWSNLQASREIMQGLDVIMRHNAAKNCLPIGSCFYYDHPERNPEQLQEGVVVLSGFQQSIKLTRNGPVACVDYSVIPYINDPVPVMKFIELNSRIKFNKFKNLVRGEISEIKRFLQHLKVTVIHRHSKKKYTVYGFSEPSADNITFVDQDNGENRKLVDYFREKYDKIIEYGNLPCLNLSLTRSNYVPMELCMVAKQRFPKELLSGYEDKKLKELAMPRPNYRAKKIMDVVASEYNSQCSGTIIDNFHIEVSKEMTETSARVLYRPILKLRDDRGNPCEIQITKDDCQWNLMKNKVHSGNVIRNWALLDFSGWLVESFADDLIQRGKELGVTFSHDYMLRESSMDILSKPNELRQLLNKIKKDFHDGLQLLICSMSRKDPGYKTLKLICETELGILTQCFLAKNAKDNPSKLSQFLANLVLKINGKLGGSNFELHQNLPVPSIEDGKHIMFIGADVNHPSGGDVHSPSVVAVVATMNWPASNKYASIVEFQKHRKESISNVGTICGKLVQKYELANRVKPAAIIYFRDGVSDSQFDMVLNEELFDMKKVLVSSDYNPSITVVVAQKRHQTRLFIEDEESKQKVNVPPGTVVEKDVTSPFHFNFFLCSHHGIIGTSKATHYYVLWDECGFTSDGIQKLIFDLCFTFARCTKPVSLVTPVYYADILAFRGRHYYEAMDTSSDSPQLHVNIKDDMFFL